MRSRRPVAFVLSAAFLVFGIHVLAAQAGGPRYALVIGNGNYSELGRLKNPANDAADMGQALKELGFKVKLLVDADLPSMEDAVVRLGSDLAQSADSVGFFFYAGHGVQAGGTNYLIPADARIASEAFLKNKALPAQSILDTLQGARNALNVVVLDACRDNPFSWGRSATRGLSVVGSQPTGSIVAYASVSFAFSKVAAPAKAAFFAGNYEPYSDISSHGENYLLGWKIAVRSGILVKVGIISKGPGSDIRMALYDDNGDYPGKLVASTSATLPPEGGRSEIPIGPVGLPAGGYWLMVQYAKATNILADTSGKRDKQIYYISLTDKDSLPSNYPSGAMNFKGFQVNYYLVMTER
ncbi:MAG: caspase family protein [Rectinemataceae bacterium]|jgi:hypothetical protein